MGKVHAEIVICSWQHHEEAVVPLGHHQSLLLVKNSSPATKSLQEKQGPGKVTNICASLIKLAKISIYYWNEIQQSSNLL